VPKIIAKGQFAGQKFDGLKVGRVFTWREGCSSLPQRAAFSSEAFSRLIQKYRPVGVDFTTSGRGRVEWGLCSEERCPAFNREMAKAGTQQLWCSAAKCYEALIRRVWNRINGMSH